MDLEVLRLVLWKETWQGLVSDCAGDTCIVPGMQNPAESGAELSKGPRTISREFEGLWKAYDIIAVPMEDDDPLTGLHPHSLATAPPTPRKALSSLQLPCRRKPYTWIRMLLANQEDNNEDHVESQQPNFLLENVGSSLLLLPHPGCWGDRAIKRVG